MSSAPLPNPRASSRGVRLLDVAPELCAALSPEEIVEVATQAVLPAAALECGPWQIADLANQATVRGEVHGFLVVSGCVTVELQLAGRSCTRLITSSELILLDGWETTSIPLGWGWSVLEPTVLAVLDARVQSIAARWPHLMIAILKLGAQQLRHALLQQAISQLPRVEDRLLALLWSVAERQGVVRRDGIWIRLAVSHETLARMIGARRPTVSLGLKELGRQGFVAVHGDGFLIDPGSIAQLS